MTQCTLTFGTLLAIGIVVWLVSPSSPSSDAIASEVVRRMEDDDDD